MRRGYCEHQFDLDTQPTVNPEALLHLKAPWDNRRSPYIDTFYTSEYERQYGWKFPLPHPLAMTSSVATATTPTAPAQVRSIATTTTATETSPTRSITTSTTALASHQDDATQTTVIPAESVLVQTDEKAPEPPKAVAAPPPAPAAPAKEVRFDAKPAPVEPVETRPRLRTDDPLFAFEPVHVEPEAIKPLDRQRLSYGWANKDFYNPEWDMKTFNVIDMPADQVCYFPPVDLIETILC